MIQTIEKWSTPIKHLVLSVFIRIWIKLKICTLDQLQEAYKFKRNKNPNGQAEPGYEIGLKEALAYLN